MVSHTNKKWRIMNIHQHEQTNRDFLADCERIHLD